MEEQKGRVETLLVIEKTPQPHLLPCHGVQQTFPWGLALARAPLVCQPAWTEAQPPGEGAGEGSPPSFLHPVPPLVTTLGPLTSSLQTISSLSAVPGGARPSPPHHRAPSSSGLNYIFQ